MCADALVSQTPKSADTQTHSHMKLSRACPGHISPTRNKYDIVRKENVLTKSIYGTRFVCLVILFSHFFSKKKKTQSPYFKMKTHLKSKLL